MAGGTDGRPLHTRLLEKLEGDVSPDWLNRSIFKVPNHLRRISEQAYEPQVISIGPYHHGKAPLEKMEKCKTFYLKKLLERRGESSLERYVTALKDMEEKAREFYSEPLNHISRENFVEMMLVDGCFIIEHIRESAMGKIGLPLADFFLSRAMIDLLLVENQLPFFILLRLFDMTVMSNDQAEGFMDMAIKFFSKIMPRCPGGPPENQEDMKHLLGLVHDCWTSSPDHRVVPDTQLQRDPESPKRSEEVRIRLLEEDSISRPAASENDAQEAKPSTSFSRPKSSEEEEEVPSESKEAGPSTAANCDNNSNRKRNEWPFIRSATQLSEAGIIFKKINGRLFDIMFEKGVMSIPTLRIDDDTESILRNLVAYEQCFKGASSKRFTDYMLFMVCLMNTGEDVELLSHHGVVDSWLGDHEVVATIFNKLGDNVLISKEDFCYAETFKEVNKHCEKKCNQWKANLLHKYFNTPWAGIAAFAAVLGLLLSVLNSVFTVLSYLSN